MNRAETAQILAYLASAWPNVDMAEETVAVWVDQLAPVDYADAEVAARSVVKSARWFPAPSEFLEHAANAARARRSSAPALPAPPSTPGRGPSCPRCGQTDEVEKLPHPIAGHGWLCSGPACWMTFDGTTSEWERMTSTRRRLAEEATAA